MKHSKKLQLSLESKLIYEKNYVLYSLIFNSCTTVEDDTNGSYGIVNTEQQQQNCYSSTVCWYTHWIASVSFPESVDCVSSGSVSGLSCSTHVFAYPLPIPHCLDDHSFIKSRQISSVSSTIFFFFCKIILFLIGPLHPYTDFRISLSWWDFD